MPPTHTEGSYVGVAGHAQDVSVAHVQHHRRGAVGVVRPVTVREGETLHQGLLRGLLHLGVEGGDERVPGLRHAAAGDGRAGLGVALRVDFHLGHAVAPAQPLVVGPLETV